ncbi:hypothetical protein FH972_001388 [Carpinus fangiana]|uniref:7-deoxyloganetic acid glucosyltransferase n=1 Tax=Carpinus fangiana TaxID=176857 RepID=A0A5N6QBY8_9ROSI|nr:hypothetical protein FH972_001388 [Carpinus fangiana]
MFDTLKSVTKPIFRKMLCSGESNTNSSRLPVSCIIADGILSFPIDIGDELGIPVIHFRTIGACCFWAYFRIPDIIEAGKGDMDRLITSVPDMETFLRCRDLPSYCRVSDLADPNLQLAADETRQSPRARALVLNTLARESVSESGSSYCNFERFIEDIRLMRQGAK